MFRKKTYYLGLNKMSDYTPQELARMENRHAADGFPPDEPLRGAKGGANKSKTDPMELRMNIDDAELGRVLQQVFREVPQVGRLLFATSIRSKRAATTNEEHETVPPRNLNMDDLIKVGKIAQDLPKAYDYAPSNNLEHEPIEQFSQGIPEQLSKVDLWDVDYIDEGANKTTMETVREYLRYRLSDMGVEFGVPASVKEGHSGEKDEVFVDHSQSDCMDLPRDQRLCASCYAFAGLTIYEWLYCKKFGKLVRFSEQYMVDCGPHVGGLACEGGSAAHILKFVRNFGLELRKNYPYYARNQTCPLDETSADLSTAGYIRFDSASGIYAYQDVWEEYLHFGPIYVLIRTQNSDFSQYSGGVHEMGECSKDEPANHSLVLVGYGQLDGVKYWKLRNSYSIGWGEGGYYRLSYASSSCLTHWGIFFASKESPDYEFDKLFNNTKYLADPIKKAYWQRMNISNPIDDADEVLEFSN